MTAALNPAHAVLDPEVLLAGGWVAAAEGTISEAVALARQAAQLAASQHQPATEVVALHTAVCFGDRTVAGRRLAELATQVDGPRAPAAAAHAAALAADDGAALHAASVQLEQMGALLLAADADAQAATAHARQDRRGSAQATATRARRLAQACEDARTPALAALTAPLPLTQPDRRAADPVSPHRRGPPLPGLRQTRRLRPLWARRPAPRRLNPDFRARSE